MARLENYMDVAEYLYDKTNNMSNLKLQKMMFFAYIEYYQKYQEELFDDDFEAWVYGPVLPKLYYSFYKLLLPVAPENKIEDKKIKEILDKVIEKYGDMEAFDLVDLTHNDPIWIKARGDLDKFELSNNKLNIKAYLDNVQKTKE